MKSRYEIEDEEWERIKAMLPGREGHVRRAAKGGVTQAERLLEGRQVTWLVEDKGYDSDLLVQRAPARGIAAVIPPRSNRKMQREYDMYLY